MYQQLWGYKVEEKLYLGVREQKRLNTTALHHIPNDDVSGTTKGIQSSTVVSKAIMISKVVVATT
jgi:hypothetical protein